MGALSPRRLLRAFRGRRLALAALLLVVALVLLALGADFVASDKPIALRRDGVLYLFPNVRDIPELRDEDNASICASLTEGDWALLPPVPYGPLQSRVGGWVRRLEPPSGAHPLGTDDRGRDVLARMVHGTRLALTVGFAAVAIYALLGILLGASAGYYGGGLDRAVSRLVEVMMAFPAFFFVLTLQGLLGTASVLQLVVVIGLTRWTDIARLVRAEVLRVRAAEFVVAARAIGLREWEILWRHVLPSSMGPVLVSCTFGVAAAVLTESALSFLGFGAPPPTPSWGELLTQAYHAPSAWWLSVFPGLAIFATVTAYNVLGEALRDMVDPHLRHVGT